jgi:uncharacterized protein YkwD
MGVLVASVVILSLIAPAAAGAQESSCTRDSGWAEVRAELALDVVTLTNAHRATLGLASLAPSTTLTNAATWKAAHMAYYDYFSHDDPHSPARSWDQRIRDCGYEGGAGENIAYGYRTAQDVLKGWLNSPGHRQNIENDDYRVLGVGAAVNDDGSIYWVQNFGMKADGGSTLAPQPTATVAPPVEEEPGPVESDVPAPVGTDDFVTTSEDESLRLNPALNDFVGQGGELEIIYHEDPNHGTVTQEENGELIYRPDPNYAGRDTFYYWVSDQFDRTCGARVTIDVQAANDAPRARLDKATVRPRTRMSVRVLANDLDVDGDELTFVSFDQMPRFGSATVSEDGVVSYRARRGTNGRTDTITYLVDDGHGGVALGTIRIRIRR